MALVGIGVTVQLTENRRLGRSTARAIAFACYLTAAELAASLLPHLSTLLRVVGAGVACAAYCAYYWQPLRGWLLPRVTIEVPARWDRTQRRTRALVADWNAFYVSMLHPDAHTYDHSAEYKRRDEAELAFRQRITEIERAYQRKGMLNELTDFSEAQLPSEAHIRTDHLGMALKRLERLAKHAP